MSRHKVEITGVNTANIKVLTNEEKLELFKKMKEGDLFAREDLINGNLKLVLSILRKFSGKVDNLDDLFQVGCLGLVKAIDNFDISYDVRLSTYACPMIEGEIKRYLRDNNTLRISRSIKDLAYKTLKLKEELSVDGKEPSNKEVADILKVTEYDISVALDSLREPVSMYEPIYNDGGDTIYLLDQLEDKTTKDLTDLLSLREALDKIKEREREKPIAELYAKKEEPKPKKFRPTPVISPVYGVLDKNYTKDEVKVQDENSYEIQRPSRKVDFETVRNKAFGTLTDDLKNVMCENCELYQEVKITKNADRKPQIDNSNLLASMTEEGPAEDISLGDAEDNYFDFGVSYEPPKKEEPKTVDITDEVKIVDHNEEESKAEKIEVKEKPETRQTTKAKENKQKLEDKDFLEDTKEFESLTHDEEDINEILKGTEDITQTDDSNDIFNLIDSMYDEEEDKK